MMTLRDDAQYIIDKVIASSLPDNSVNKAILELYNNKCFYKKNVYLIAVGKAAFQMTKAAIPLISRELKQAICITKYKHVLEHIEHPKVKYFEAGHPIVDENSLLATKEVLDVTSNLTKDDVVLFLLSGGGSALFEDSDLPLIELSNINKQLLAVGASITEVNTIRKRLSNVKGGKFAQKCLPAHVYSIILSDIIGDPLDMIASGPTQPDSCTYEDALKIINKYNISLSKDALKLIKTETPKELNNITNMVTGSVKELCSSAKQVAEEIGYETHFLTDTLDCEASSAGQFLSSIAKSYQHVTRSTAFILGGETVVKLKGNGLGGRNQEFALSAAKNLSTCIDTAIFSVGSDGTDGPTDAAGGYVDNKSYTLLNDLGIDIYKTLENNDSYTALKVIDGLVITGPTGTNVNDFAVLLIKR